MGKNDLRGALKTSGAWLGSFNLTVLACLVLSVAIHSMFTALFLWPQGTEPRRPEEKVVLDLRLDMPAAAREENRARKEDSRDQKQPPRQPEGGQGGASGGDRDFQVLGGQRHEISLPVSVDSPEMRELLTGIKAEIAPLWIQAQPPGMGQVELRMEINSRGEVSSLWITRLRGAPELGDFVAELVRRAGPFPASKLTQSGPVVVDCTFDIVGGSQARVE
jgi:outer membrane biosynthesis protein TonB